MDRDILLAAANLGDTRVSEWKVPLVDWNLPNVDRELFLKLVSMNGAIIKDSNEDIKNDLEVVLLAYGQRRDNLQLYAGEKVRMEILNGVEQSKAFKFVKKYPMKMRLLPMKNRNDDLVVMEAFRQKRKSFKYAGDELVKKHPIFRILKKTEGDIERAFEIYSRNTPIPEQTRLDENWENFLEDELKKVEGLRVLFRKEKFNTSNEKEDIEYLRERFRNVRFEDLEVIRLLGAGAYGRVYLCHIKGILYRTFAVKVYLPYIAKSEEKVVDTLNRDCLDIEFHKNVVLSHLNEGIFEGEGVKSNYMENIKKLPDYKEYWKNRLPFISGTTKTPIIIMKYHRINLQSYFKQRTKFYPYEIARMMNGIISGGYHLHKHKIVHRDLHSHNIFVDPKYGRIWIGDFGCSLDLRKNDTGFLVNKDHEQMFSFSFYCGTGGEIKKNEAELWGGCTDSLAPEINPSNPELNNTDYLNYEKSDVFSIGLIGMWLLKKIEFREHKKNEIVLPQMFRSFFEKLLKENVDERLSFKEAFDEMNKISKIAVDS